MALVLLEDATQRDLEGDPGLRKKGSQRTQYPLIKEYALRNGGLNIMILRYIPLK